MTRPFRKNVGLIGLGIIGRRIAEHLRRQGLSVFVWNRTPRPVPNFVGSPRELAQTCNYLQIFVSDDDALMQMIQTISMSLTPHHIVIAHPPFRPIQCARRRELWNVAAPVWWKRRLPGANWERKRVSLFIT